MHLRSRRIAAVIAVALVIALAGVHQARAAGAVNINSCQTLSGGNTTYKLTADLTSCDTCLVVAADKITIDLQGHSITNTGCPGANVAIYDEGSVFDVITVKNGSVSGYSSGVFLVASTRVSVLGVTAHDNDVYGIATGSLSLVKASTTYNNGVAGILAYLGDRAQIQQCNAHHNGAFGIIAESSSNCLITMNIANANGTGIETAFGNKCTVSFNTSSNNGNGINAGLFGGNGHLVTQNVALSNSANDYGIACPSDVTNNTSTNGFPASYAFSGSGCHTVNNN